MTRRADPAWGKHPHALLSLEEAWRRIAAEVRPPPAETVALDCAPGRVLARPLLADEDQPPFDKAMMDGFAVRAADCRGPGARLTILGLAPAGRLPDRAVGPGQAMRINTGAPLPAGADAVVRVEDTTSAEDDTTVDIQVAVEAGRHVARRGSDRRTGDLLLAPPVRLGPAQIAAAATAGAAVLPVFPEVRVAIATTGDELVPVGRPREKPPGHIFESNGPMLAALMRQFGAVPQPLGILPDEPEALDRGLAEALRRPVVLTVGGMSMGTRDLVPRAFERLGVAWRFHGVRVRPGKPVAYGRGPDGQHVFGLPGNPVSAFVCAWLFVRMAVRGLGGLAARPPRRWPATLTRDLAPARDDRPAFLPARVWPGEAADPGAGPSAPDGAGSALRVEPCGWSGSADPFGLALANALLVRAHPRMPAPAGSRVDVILISTEV